MPAAFILQIVKILIGCLVLESNHPSAITGQLPASMSVIPVQIYYIAGMASIFSTVTIYSVHLNISVLLIIAFLSNIYATKTWIANMERTNDFAIILCVLIFFDANTKMCVYTLWKFVTI